MSVFNSLLRPNFGYKPQTTESKGFLPLKELSQKTERSVFETFKQILRNIFLPPELPKLLNGAGHYIAEQEVSLENFESQILNDIDTLNSSGNTKEQKKLSKSICLSLQKRNAAIATIFHNKKLASKNGNYYEQSSAYRDKVLTKNAAIKKQLNNFSTEINRSVRSSEFTRYPDVEAMFREEVTSTISKKDAADNRQIANNLKDINSLLATQTGIQGAKRRRKHTPSLSPRANTQSKPAKSPPKVEPIIYFQEASEDQNEAFDPNE